LTVPQTFFETPSNLIERIEAAERAEPTPGGYYRVHRLPFWEKVGWYKTSQPDRYQDLVRWERRTLQPKYGVPLGLEYTLVEGTAELYDYMFFFSPFEGIHSEQVAEALAHDPEARLVTHPRRGFDLWNSRYFILPYIPANDEHRSYYAFLAETEVIAPRFGGSEDRKAKERWAETEDWQLRRNLDAFPRAWVVHDAIIRPPISGLNRGDRAALMEDITYKNDPTWSVRGKVVYDPREVAWVELENQGEIHPYLSRSAVQPSEAPRITRYETERVEIEVDLKTPGIVVLADVFYPGWRLTVDGEEAPIYRTNRLMRGAALTAGRHRLVYTYEPNSVRVGLALSTVGLLALGSLAVWCWRHRADGNSGEG
ncbi:MAG TPA: hypothetical protein VFT74_01590, partial [Isosphaeraceae bacterium]|nr:hypothetical protein [Isosphaeraceae bacterium]